MKISWALLLPATCSTRLSEVHPVGGLIVTVEGLTEMAATMTSSLVVPAGTLMVRPVMVLALFNANNTPWLGSDPRFLLAENGPFKPAVVCKLYSNASPPSRPSVVLTE